MVRKLLLILGILALAVACGSDSNSDGNGPERGSIGQPTPSIRYDGPDPASGMGNVYGRITWNNEAAEGLDVLLCEDFSSFSGCNGREFSAQTDSDGYYLFSDVEPGTYALSVRVFDSDNWLYVTSGILSSADFEVEANDTLVIDSKNIFKLDVTTTTPAQNGKVKSGEVMLIWDSYPDASYYELYLTPDKGEAILVNQRADTNQLPVGLLPVNCAYRWTVEAFSSAGVKLAETADYSEFSVAGEEASCQLRINSPVDGAAINGGNVELDWEPHPTAASYKILMWNDTDPDKPNILDFVGVAEAYYAFDQPLEPARYVWSVDAYNIDGIQIAESEIYDFTVNP